MPSSPVQISGNNIIMPASGTVDGVDVSTIPGSISAKMGGTAGTTDNVVPRADGTGGLTLQASSMVVSDAGVLSGVTVADPVNPTDIANRQYVLANAVSPTAATLVSTLETAQYELVLTARFAFCGALSATESGSAGAEVFTFSGLLTAAQCDGVTPAVGDLVLVYFNAADPKDGGVFVYGESGGNSTLTRSTLLNTAQLLAMTSVRCAEGDDWAGVEFRLNKSTSQITVGTTVLNYTPERSQRGKYSYEIFEDFDEQGTGAGPTATIAAANTTSMFGTAMMAHQASGTASVISYNNIPHASYGSRTVRGVGIFDTGTTSGGLAQCYSARGVVLATETRHVLEGLWNIPTLSDGTNTFILNHQWQGAAVAALGAFLEGNQIKLRVGSASSFSTPVLGPTVVAGQNYRVRVIKNAGVDTATLIVDGIPYGTAGGFSTTEVSQPAFGIYKLAGPLARTVVVDQLRWSGFDPLGRGR